MSPQPSPIDRAHEDLRVIRDTMARAGGFTAVPGWGGVAMGVFALAAGWLGRETTGAELTRVWLWTAVPASAAGVAGMAWKARRAAQPLLGAAGRRFALAFVPALLAAALLTAALAAAQQDDLLPGLWLLLYGAAVTAGGAASIRVVPLLGGLFMLLGSVAVGLPEYGNLLLTAGFGGLQLAFGLYLARRHGG